MAHGRNKCQSRENRARVRRILLQEWDPIGIRDAPEASDEYDRYADRAYVMANGQLTFSGAADELRGNRALLQESYLGGRSNGENSH